MKNHRTKLGGGKSSPRYIMAKAESREQAMEGQLKTAFGESNGTEPVVIGFNWVTDPRPMYI